MKLTNDGMDFCQFTAVPCPYYLPRFMNAIVYTLPAIAEGGLLSYLIWRINDWLAMKVMIFMLSYWLCGDANDTDPVDPVLYSKLKGIQISKHFNNEQLEMQKISTLLKLRREAEWRVTHPRAITGPDGCKFNSFSFRII